MKLAPLAVLTLSLVAMGCSKKSTPEFESTVSDWRRSACSCYENGDDANRCPEAPSAELSGVEQLMVNAGVLNDDKRREVVSAAQSFVTECARASAARKDERRRNQSMRDLQLNFGNLKVPGANAPAQKRRPSP